LAESLNQQGEVSLWHEHVL